jgi:hypothetical protein
MRIFFKYIGQQFNEAISTGRDTAKAYSARSLTESYKEP